MWSDLPVRNLVSMQRQAAIAQVGREVKRLHEEGYAVEADKLLEQLHERIQIWRAEEQM